MASGQPGWLAAADSHLGSAAQPPRPGGLDHPCDRAGHGRPRHLPAVTRRPGDADPGLVLAAAIWLAEGLGGVLTGSGTDPNSGPLLVLLAACVLAGGDRPPPGRGEPPRRRGDRCDRPLLARQRPAAVMIATAAYCFSRLVAAWRWRRPTDYDVDGVHVLMGVGMAGMLVPRLNPAAGSGWDIGGAAVFGAAMAWFGWQTIQGYRGGRAGPHAVAHHGQHLLASGAMLYMFLALPSARAGGLAAGTAMAAATGARIPTFALLLALGLLGYVIWTTDRLSSLALARVIRYGERRGLCLRRAVRLGLCLRRAVRPSLGFHRAARPCSGLRRAGHVAAARSLLRDPDGRGHGLHADHDALTEVRIRRSPPSGGWSQGADRAGCGLRGRPIPRRAAARAWPGPTGWPGPERPSRPV